MLKYLLSLLKGKEPEDLIDAWIDALKSGYYLQGTGRLRRFKNKYCCLGVLCDISGYGKWVKEYDGEYYYKTETAKEKTRLPQELVNELSRVSGQGVAEIEQIVDDLINLNDRKGADFNYIAVEIRHKFSQRSI